MQELKKAVEMSGAVPKLKRIRGGTDGASLTARGIPCPNIFTGGAEFHSHNEWLSVDGMEKSIKTLLNLILKS